jgi:hopanoid-associated phosphorylase
MFENPAGIVTGLQLEARIARRAAEGAVTVCAGPGPARAREAAEWLAAQQVSGLVSFGMAAGLVAELGAGVVIVPATVISGSGQELAADIGWRERLMEQLRAELVCADAPLVSTAQPLVSYLDKAALWARTQAIAADMESAAVAAVARRARLPFVAVRVICDPVDFPLPPAALAAVNDRGRLNMGGLVRSLWKRPGQLRRLVELSRLAGMAKRSLQTAARLAGPRFGLVAAAPARDPQRPIAHTRR